MSHPRLSLALAGAAALSGSGGVLVVGPRAATGLGDLPKERLVLVQGFFPDHEALVRQGFRVLPSLAGAGADFVAAVVFLPRARIEARAMVAEAAARVPAGGAIWVDGQKTDGIDSMLRDLRARTDVAAVLSKAHGKVFRFDAGADFSDWAATPLHPVPGFTTLPGVFSADRPDRGSVLLAAALPKALNGAVVDLGAGWGYLSAAILAQERVTSLDLVEADHAALDCARANIRDPRARFHWADAAGFRPDSRPDTVVMNPPFHIGRAGDPALGIAFIRAAAAMLTPSGALYMVANRHLPYETALAAAFREVAEIGGDAAFKIFRAARPLADRRAPARGRR